MMDVTKGVWYCFDFEPTVSKHYYTAFTQHFDRLKYTIYLFEQKNQTGFTRS